METLFRGKRDEGELREREREEREGEREREREREERNRGEGNIRTERHDDWTGGLQRASSIFP